MQPIGSSDLSLGVLITNLTLSGRTGTEVVTRDLALGLLRRGHRPFVYTRDASGPIAEELRRSSIPVITEIENLAMPIDVIHGHHTPTTATVICKYPKTPAIFLAHDFISWKDAPPGLSSIRRNCAVDATVGQRFSTNFGYHPSDISIILNAVDMGRFKPGPQLASKPRRALIFAKNKGHLSAIKQACANWDLKFDVVGSAVGNVIDNPETVLADYDLVFTSALSALEALACGRAVVVCDGRGLAGLVTPENMKEWRRKNFGLACLTEYVTAENISSEIGKYDAGAAELVAEYIRNDADQDTWLDKFEDMYRLVIAENKVEPVQTTYSDIARYMETWSPGIGSPWPWIRERKKLNNDLKKLHVELEATRNDARAAKNDAKREPAGLRSALQGLVRFLRM